MKSMLIFGFLVLSAVMMQGCVSTAGSPQFFELPTGQVVTIQHYSEGYVVAPVSESSAREQSQLIKKKLDYELALAKIRAKSVDQARDDNRSKEREENRFKLEVFKTVTSAVDSAADRAARQQKEKLQALGNQPKPQGYRKPEVRRQEQESTMSAPKPAPQRQKAVSPPPAQRQPRQATVSTRQSAVKLAPAPMRSR